MVLKHGTAGPRFSQEGWDWRLGPRRVADVRSGTPEGPRGRHGYILGNAPESLSGLHPSSRPPVQPVRPVSPVEETWLSHLQPSPASQARAGGWGAKGAGMPLKGTPAAALRPLPGGGEDLAAAATPGEGGGVWVLRLPAASISVPRHSQLGLSVHPRSPADQRHLRHQLQSAQSPSPRTRAGARPGQASDSPPAPCVDSPTATAIYLRTRKLGPVKRRPCARHRHLLVGFRKPIEDDGEGIADHPEFEASGPKSPLPFWLPLFFLFVLSSFRAFLCPEGILHYQSSWVSPKSRCLVLQPVPPTQRESEP